MRIKGEKGISFLGKKKVVEEPQKKKKIKFSENKYVQLLFLQPFSNTYTTGHQAFSANKVPQKTPKTQQDPEEFISLSPRKTTKTSFKFTPNSEKKMGFLAQNLYNPMENRKDHLEFEGI